MAVPKEKERFVIYLYPETLEKIKELYRNDDCRTQSQFVEKALRFYIGHLLADDDASYLPNAMFSNMKRFATIHKQNRQQSLRLLPVFVM